MTSNILKDRRQIKYKKRNANLETIIAIESLIAIRRVIILF